MAIEEVFMSGKRYADEFKIEAVKQVVSSPDSGHSRSRAFWHLFSHEGYGSLRMQPDFMNDHFPERSQTPASCVARHVEHLCKFGQS